MSPLAPLISRDQWIVVLLTPLPGGKTRKLPCNYRSGTPGVDAHNPQHWTTYETARSVATTCGPEFTVGFVLTEADPLWCLDIDGALNVTTGQWSDVAQHLCGSLQNTVIEVSQSGRGLHIWGQGPVPAHSSKRVDLQIELYTERRFICIGTGQVGDMSQPCPNIAAIAAQYFPPRVSAGLDVPDDGPRADWHGPSDDAELIRRALKSRSAASAFSGKASFADLWTADADALARTYPAEGGGYDASSADAALASHLAYWSGCHVARVERLMRQSALARSKWDERADYLVERTIMGACSSQRDVLQDKPTEPGPSTSSAPAAAAMRRVEGETFLSPDAQVEHFKGCVYVLGVHRVLVPGGHLLRPDQFNAQYGGFTFAMDARNEKTTRKAFEAFTESQALKAPKVDGTCFRPDLPYGAIVQDPGRTRANTYAPVDVPRKPGDVKPFLDHLAKLLPNDRDRMICLCMLAALVQHQGYKFQWAIVLQGVEGNGKTLLSRCVAAAIGARYVHWPKASKLAGNFNGWMVGRTFFAVEDIHTSENVDVIEELKPMITGGDGLEIESKGVDQISAEICGNFMFNTNLATGIRKTRNDRRFCWLATAQQQFSDLARDGMSGDYMHRLYTWLGRDGYAIVSEYLWTFDIPDEFNPATGCQRAPITSSTEAAIEAGMGRVEQEIMQAAERGDPGFANGWISTLAVERLLSGIPRCRDLTPLKRAGVIESLGYVVHPGLASTKGQVHHPVLPDGGKPKLYITKTHPSSAIGKAADVARAYTADQVPPPALQ